MQRTWEDNAREFGALIKQGKDLRLALLVACSVEKATNQHAKSVDGKVSVGKFAEAANTSGKRVVRHLEAWDKLAEQVGLPLSATLMPIDVGMELNPEVIEVFAGMTLGSEMVARPGSIKKNPDAVAELLANDEDFRKEVADRGGVVPVTPAQVAAAVANDPAVADAVADNRDAVKAVNEAESRTETGRQLTRDATRARNERDAKDDETVYHLRGLRALPVLWEAQNLADFIETKVVREPEDIALARNYGEWLQAIGRRIVAWADGDTLPLSEEDFAAGIEAIMGEAK